MMDIFVIILMAFTVIGFIDKIIGGRLGLSKEIDKGLAAMGTVAVYIIGIYCVGTTLIERNAEAIAGLTSFSPIDPSMAIGCLLCPEMGAVPIALGLASDEAVGYFSGVIVAGCLGQFVGFQLPVIFSMLDIPTKKKMVRGFLCGVIAIPFGLLAGGLAIGVEMVDLIVNMSVISTVCMILLFGFIKFPAITENALLIISSLVRVVAQLLFIVVIIGLFITDLAIVPREITFDALYMILKITVIICGGLVMAKLILSKFDKVLHNIASRFATNKAGVVGLLLNMINSLTVVPIIGDMDDNGTVINGAFSVSGAYILGGQLAFVLAATPTYVFSAFLISKLTAGVLSIAMAMFLNKHRNKEQQNETDSEAV